MYFLLCSLPSPCFICFYAIKIHIIISIFSNHAVRPVSILVSRTTWVPPVQPRVQRTSLVDCHCYWQRPCNAEWVRWGKTSVNLGFTSLTPVDQLWCKLREGRALVGPTQYAAAVLLWCNAAPLRSPSRAIDFHQLASWRGAAVRGFVSIFCHF